MTDIWVLDAAPLILLAKANLHTVLPQLAQELLIPSAVAREIRQGLPSDPARQALEAGFGTRVRVAYVPATVRALPGLDRGEQTVLALACKRRDCTVVLDDAKGRQAADSLGIPKIGSLGVLLLAKRRGHLPEVAPALHALRDAGLYLDDRVIRPALAAVGETWP